MMGPNGSGKTTLFELITGSQHAHRRAGARSWAATFTASAPTSATASRSTIISPIRCGISARSRPTSCWSRAGCDYPLVHLFDEPQFNTQDGYIGFMLDFFRRLRAEGRLVFLCVHPNERFHLEILQEICERFIFVNKGAVTPLADYDALLAHRARPRLSGQSADRARRMTGAATRQVRRRCASRWSARD